MEVALEQCERENDPEFSRWVQGMTFAEYQDELYAQGQTGHQPQYPIRFDDLEKKASAAMTPKGLAVHDRGRRR